MDKRELLLKSFSGDKAAIAHFARYCKKIALVYLKSKIAAGNYYILEVNLQLDDLAWDCISGLFERDEDGKFIELESYFDRNNIKNISEADFQIKCRRLVFSKVNDGLFRNFGNYDSSLSKIIRNIKNACSELDLDIRRINKNNTILFGGDTPSEPVSMPPEFLEIHLSGRITEKMNMVDVMKEIEDIINNQQKYKHQLNLVELARIIRRTFVYNHGDRPSVIIPENKLFLNGELEQILDEAIEQYKKSLYSTYVDSGKVNEEIFQSYIKAARRIVSHNYIQEKQNGDSYYEQLRELMPSLEKRDYRSNHRQYLEYIVKKIRKEVLRRVKKIYEV